MVTDVYNTGKGYAFVTFDRKEDAETVSGVLCFGCLLYTHNELKVLQKKTWSTFNPLYLYFKVVLTKVFHPYVSFIFI